MPIKFRCQHCKQLLGIAHTKAGKLVDCPTCGRTLRVPNLDGSIDPPPVLGMNLADDGLRQALDELGQIGKDSDETCNSKLSQKSAEHEPPKQGRVPDAPVPNPLPREPASMQPTSFQPAGDRNVLQRPITQPPSWTNAEAQRIIAHADFSQAENLAPNQLNDQLSGQTSDENQGQQQPLNSPDAASPVMPRTVATDKSEAAPAEVPMAVPAVIELEPLASHTSIDPPSMSRNGAEIREGQPAGTPATTSGPDDDVLAELARSNGRETTRTREAASKVGLATEKSNFLRASRSTIIAGLVCFLFGLAIGFTLGQGSSRTKLANESPNDSHEHTVADQVNVPTRLSGRLSYSDPQGRLQPDAGARILILPMSASKKEKLPGIGFRSSDGQTNRDLADKALADVGGFKVVADAEGKYSVDFSSSGDFQLIALSKFQGRKSDASWPKRAEGILRTLFDRPEQLVEKRAFHLETIQHEGVGMVIWNHVFEWE